MSPLQLVRQLPQRRVEDGVGPGAVPLAPLGVVNQCSKVVCVIAAGCQFPDPCAVACWLDPGKR